MFCFFFFKQKTAYEMRISDWSSDVCSSDLLVELEPVQRGQADLAMRRMGGIERAAEQADTQAQARAERGKPGHAGLGCSVWGEMMNGRDAYGRIWPVPCTRYLKVVSCSTPTGPRACILPVAMQISPPKPNSPPSANCVEALCRMIALSSRFMNSAAWAAFSVRMASVWLEPWEIGSASGRARVCQSV